MSADYNEYPLLAGVLPESRIFLQSVIDEVVRGDLNTAVDVIFRMSEDEIPDVHAMSFLELAQNLCASIEYADGWILFRKEIVRLLFNSGQADKSNMLLKELEELLPGDAELMSIRKSINALMKRNQAKDLMSQREKEEVDVRFEYVMEQVAPMSEDELFELIKSCYNSLHIENKNILTNYITKYPFWGSLNPTCGVFDTLRNRAHVIRSHFDDFLWLHNRLADARSKNVLYAILSNWIYFDYHSLTTYSDREIPEYYHPDVFLFRNDEVFVDAGAYNGDSAIEFIKAYGVEFKRIYCYEINPGIFKELEKNTSNIPRIVLRRKAVGAVSGKMFFDEGVDESTSQVRDFGEMDIEVVRIDEDIIEPVSFIKMDIEGGEKDALRGCEKQIRENHPNLAISTYHGYDDIYAIPRLIDEITQGYNFYMRHHGQNLFPTEFSLLAEWG